MHESKLYQVIYEYETVHCTTDTVDDTPSPPPHTHFLKRYCISSLRFRVLVVECPGAVAVHMQIRHAMTRLCDLNL
jgi:hypothetical protein